MAKTRRKAGYLQARLLQSRCVPQRPCARLVGVPVQCALLNIGCVLAGIVKCLVSGHQSELPALLLDCVPIYLPSAAVAAGWDASIVPVCTLSHVLTSLLLFCKGERHMTLWPEHIAITHPTYLPSVASMHFVYSTFSSIVPAAYHFVPLYEVVEYVLANRYEVVTVVLVSLQYQVRALRHASQAQPGHTGTAIMQAGRLAVL